MNMSKQRDEKGREKQQKQEYIKRKKITIEDGKEFG